MVDREARDKLAELIRHFASGQITNVQLVSALPRRAGDRALQAIADELEESFATCEKRAYRLKIGRPLSREDRRVLARVILFLHSELEHCHPDWTVGLCCLLGLCAAGTVVVFAAQVVDNLAAVMPCWVAFVSACLLPAATWILVWWATGALTGRAMRALANRSRADEDVWPFFRCSELEEAAKHPRLLCGKWD